MTGKSIINFITNKLNEGLYDDSKLTNEEITELIKVTLGVESPFKKVKEKINKKNLFNELMLLEKKI